MSKVFKELEKKSQYEVEQGILNNWLEKDIFKRCFL